MGRLIQAKMLILFKSLGYKSLLLCSAGFGVLVSCIFIFAEITTMNGYLLYMQALKETQSKYLLISIFAATFVCSEFSNRTFGIAIMSGCSRLRLILAKAIAYIVGLIPLVLIYPLVGTIIMTIHSGFGEMNPELWQHLFLTTFLHTLGMIASGLFCFMLAVLIRNIGGTIGGTFGILVLLDLFVLLTSTLPSFKTFIFTYQLLQASEPESLPMYYLVMGVTSAILLLASIGIFKKAELK